MDAVGTSQLSHGLAGEVVSNKSIDLDFAESTLLLEVANGGSGYGGA